MVDREPRRKYAELIRQFISGRMTNDEYEDRFEAIEVSRDDHAVSEIYRQVWFLYDDFKTHRMTGKHRLNNAGRRQTAQIVLFLQSDREYNWPQGSLAGCLSLLLLIVCGFATVSLINYLPENALFILGNAVFVSVVLILFAVLKNWQEKQDWKKAGDADAWPFLLQTDLDEAKRHPRLLAGRR